MKSVQLPSGVVLVLLLLGATACRPRPPAAPAGAHFMSPEAAAPRRFDALGDQVAAEPGAVRTRSGLVYRELEPGSGPAPREPDTVTVRYRAMGADGVVVEDTAQFGGAVTVDLARLRPCLREALMRMRAGGTSRFVCPLVQAGNRSPEGPARSFPVALQATLVAVGQPLPPQGH